MDRFVKITRVAVFMVAVLSLVFGSLIAPTSIAAYAGESSTWQILKNDKTAFILVTAYDVGDVYANTDAVNLVDAAFVKENFGSDYKNVRSTGVVTPVAGTTVVRKFSFTLKGKDGILLVADEYGPHIWLFMFWANEVRGSQLDNFVSGTILASTPTNIPLGYGEAKLKQ
ncbi:MAG: hypothetical protein ACR2OU_20340 [Thermomicrobiales bacterium]